MTRHNQPPHNQPPDEESRPEVLSPYVASKVFGPEAVELGVFEAHHRDSEAAAEIHKKILEAKAEEQEMLRLAAEAERTRLLDEQNKQQKERERQASQQAEARAAATALKHAEKSRKTKRRRRAGAFALGAVVIVGASGASAFLYDDFFGDQQASAAASLPSPSASPSASPTVSAPPSETPKPSPSATETAPPNALAAAKDLASIQIPQPQPFKNEYPVAANGDIKGYVGYYKAGTTPEEVQWMESCGNTTEKVQLAFDDSGSEAHIRKMAALLLEMDVGAIFFLNTYNTPKDGHQPLSQDLVNYLRNAGFGVANHSSTHPDMTKQSDEEIRQEIIAGGPANLIRLPYGATYKDESNNIYIDDRVLKVAKSTGAAVCMWSVDALDWENGATVESILANVERDVAPGASVLFHVDPSYPTLEALPKVVEVIKGKGLQLCPPSDKPTTADFSDVKICSSSSQ